MECPTWARRLTDENLRHAVSFDVRKLNDPNLDRDLRRHHRGILKAVLAELERRESLKV